MELVIPSDSDLMLVDDDVDLHFLVSRFYERASNFNASLISMYTGDECLDWFDDAIATNAKLPGVLLMDINMPRLSGFECVKKIRERKSCIDIPIIIMLSSSFNDNDIERAMECGADNYMEKRVVLDEILRSSLPPHYNYANAS